MMRELMEIIERNIPGEAYNGRTQKGELGMERYTGKSVLKGIAIGRIYWYRKQQYQVVRTEVSDKEAEKGRFADAVKTAKEQLAALYEETLTRVGEDHAMIFDIHKMMLEDDDYLDAVQTVIEERSATAEYAVATIRQEFAATFAAMENAYMRARAADVQDVSHRLVNILTGTTQPPILEGRPAILAADDLTPSEMMELDRERLLGFITRDPSPDSHAAILARTMGIPALMGVDFDDSWEGRLAALDGCGHCVYVDPTTELLDVILRKQRDSLERETLLQT